MVIWVKYKYGVVLILHSRLLHYSNSTDIITIMEQQENNNQFSKEAKRDRFIRLATIRTNAVLDRLRVLGHCSNKSAYSFTEDDVNKIFDEIEDEVRLVRARFQSRKKREIKLD